MRKFLDALYLSAAALAALFMVGLLVMVLLSIVSRQLQFHVPGWTPTLATPLPPRCFWRCPPRSSMATISG